MRRLTNGGEEEGVDDGDATNERCMFCDAYGGFVVRCSGCNTDTDTHTDSSGVDLGSAVPSSSSKRGRCACVFHPLCAWFQGVHIQTRITDPTFQVYIIIFYLL